MKKYRIRVVHDPIKPEFWPEVKGWLGWRNVRWRVLQNYVARWQSGALLPCRCQADAEAAINYDKFRRSPEETIVRIS